MGFTMILKAYRSVDEGQLVPINLRIPEGFSIDIIDIKVLYWYGAMFIHQWFRDNVDCDYREFMVEREQLEELLAKLKLAIDSKDESIFPVQEYEYPEGFYWREIKRTEKELRNILEKFDDTWEFEYCGS